MTSVPRAIPTFMLANMEQIMAPVFQIALAKAQGLQTTPGPQGPPLVNDCPIVNLTPATAF